MYYCDGARRSTMNGEKDGDMEKLINVAGNMIDGRVYEEQIQETNTYTQKRISLIIVYKKFLFLFIKFVSDRDLSYHETKKDYFWSWI